MSDESIKAPTRSDNNLAPALNYIGNKVRVKFAGSCLKQDKITYTHGKIVNICIVYEINLWNHTYSSDPTVRNCLFGAVKLVKKNADIDKYKCSGYGIGLDTKGTFEFPAIGFSRNVIIFGVDLSSSGHIDNKKKDILILGFGPTQGLEDTLTAEKLQSINFTKHNKKFCLNLHYNGANNYLFVNGTEIIKFKVKDSEIAAYPLCLGNISKNFSVDNMKKTGFYGYVYDFSFDYNAIAVNDKLGIHKYLMKKHSIK